MNTQNLKWLYQTNKEERQEVMRLLRENPKDYAVFNYGDYLEDIMYLFNRGRERKITNHNLIADIARHERNALLYNDDHMLYVLRDDSEESDESD
jgi:hypothetical protein